jgi:hypothetical protein
MLCKARTGQEYFVTVSYLLWRFSQIDIYHEFHRKTKVKSKKSKFRDIQSVLETMNVQPKGLSNFYF